MSVVYGKLSLHNNQDFFQDFVRGGAKVLRPYIRGGGSKGLK